MESDITEDGGNLVSKRREFCHHKRWRECGTIVEKRHLESQSLEAISYHRGKMESGFIEGGGNQRGWKQSSLVEEGRKDSVPTEVRRFLPSWMFKGVASQRRKRVWHHRSSSNSGITEEGRSLITEVRAGLAS